MCNFQNKFVWCSIVSGSIKHKGYLGFPLRLSCKDQANKDVKIKVKLELDFHEEHEQMHKQKAMFNSTDQKSPVLGKFLEQKNIQELVQTWIREIMRTNKFMENLCFSLKNGKKQLFNNSYLF